MGRASARARSRAAREDAESWTGTRIRRVALTSRIPCENRAKLIGLLIEAGGVTERCGSLVVGAFARHPCAATSGRFGALPLPEAGASRYDPAVTSAEVGARVRELIRDVPDFPKPGITFKDLTPVFACGTTLRALSESLADRYRPRKVDAVVAIESRGFLVGTPMAMAMDRGVVLVRKKGKLPPEVEERTYALEYGEDTLQIRRGALQPGMRVVVVDDLLATGGTMRATLDLVRGQGADVVEAAFVVELGFLEGRGRLADVDCHAVVSY